MTTTQFEAEAGRRAELRKANEKALAFMADEIESTLRLPRSSFDKEAKDDQTLARCLLGVLLRELVELHGEKTTYLLVGGVLDKIEVTPEALMTALEDLRKIFTPRKQACRACGALNEQKAA